MADELDRFLGECRAAGVGTAILAWQDEWDLTDNHGFGPVRRARLLAYAAGRIIATDVPGDAVDHDALAARLGAAGLRVERRCRNLAAYQSRQAQDSHA